MLANQHGSQFQVLAVDGEEEQQNLVNSTNLSPCKNIVVVHGT